MVQLRQAGSLAVNGENFIGGVQRAWAEILIQHGDHTPIDSPFPVLKSTSRARGGGRPVLAELRRIAAQALRPSRVPVPRTANTLVARLTAPSHVLPRLRAVATCWHPEEAPLSGSNDRKGHLSGGRLTGLAGSARRMSVMPRVLKRWPNPRRPAGGRGYFRFDPSRAALWRAAIPGPRADGFLPPAGSTCSWASRVPAAPLLGRGPPRPLGRSQSGWGWGGSGACVGLKIYSLPSTPPSWPG